MKYLYILIFCLAIFVRFYNFSGVPPSPYWDEVSLGYDAYSILKTGKDHHGNPFPIVAFESYGDWKPSGYYYTLVPLIGIFGLNDFTLRLPSLLAGLAIVVGIGFLARQIKINPLIAIFVASISPWAIQFSRVGWEVNLATATIVWGVVCGLIAVRDKKLFLPLQLASIFLFIFSMYTYHAARIVAPVLSLTLFLLQIYVLLPQEKKVSVSAVRKIIKNNLVQYVVIGIVGIILLSPLLASLGNQETTQRFQETSIFNNLDIIIKSNEQKTAEGNSLLSKIFYHRYVLFSREILKNYFSHFTLDFLFLSGDKNPRHSVQLYGQLYHVELLFLLLGLYAWVRRITAKKIFFLFWLAIAIIPAAITYAAPHALRILPAMPIFLLLIATGIAEFLIYLKRVFKTKIPIFFVLIILGIYVIEFLPFWTFYQKIYPIKYSQEWQYGYKEMMQSLLNFHQQFPDDQIYVSREKGRPAMYYWYYNQIDPVAVQKEEATTKKDQSEFLEYEKIFFVNDPQEVITQKALVAGSNDFFAKLEPEYTTTIVATILDLDGTTVWKIGWVVKK